MMLNIKRKPIFPVGPSIAYIPLTKGQYSLIDSEDIPRISEHNWCSITKTKCFYGGRSIHGKGKCATIHLHRVILGTSDEKFTDHINGNTLDNRKSNLREASHLENMWNCRKNIKNISGYKGVCWDKETAKWHSRCMKDGKMKHLGYFRSKADAAQAYALHAYINYGEFARII